MRRQQKSKKFISADISHIAPYGIVILSAFLVGGIFAAVFAFLLPELTVKELHLYLDDFFRNIKASGTDSFALFRHSLLANLRNFGIIFLFAVMLPGALFLGLFSGFGGFTGGFTLFFLLRLYGFRAVLFALLGILPHALLLLPAYFVALSASLYHAVTLLKEPKEPKHRLFRLSLCLVGALSLTLASSLLQAYIEPALIRLIANLFI